MNETLNIIAVSQGYATDDKYKSQNVFVHELMREFLVQGAKPTVISPEPQFVITRHPSLLRGLVRSQRTENVIDGIRVIRTRYITFPARSLPILGSTIPWSQRSFTRAVMRGYRFSSVKPQLCYAHFLYKEGAAALHLAEHLRIPAVVALGEYSFEQYESHVGLAKIRDDLSRFAKIVAVSESIKRTCIDRYGVSENRIDVFPNGVNREVFYPRNRADARQLLGLPQDRPIVAFVGSFTERKGPQRLLESLKSRPDIGVVMLGNGFDKPFGPQVLYSGSVSHDEVPVWLNAADVFALPTLAEGSCNAILEAMACGLPIVSSNISSNREILNQDSGILVNPRNPVEIGEAIRSLIDDPNRRTRMGLHSKKRAKHYCEKTRAKRILRWIADDPPVSG